MVALWICLCVFLNCAGWILSVAHVLNRTGYAAAFALAVVGLLIWKRRTGYKLLPSACIQKLRRRFRSGFPLMFLILAGLAFLGGAFHGPSNYDGLAYRIPRSLHWLAADQWHWIHTDFPRLNTRATGFEWLCTPVIAFTGTDRFVFLINTVTFFFLPGLFFSVLTRFGVRKRVAQVWMWLLPTGYCYLLQAGSIGNDLVGSFYALAAVDFALRARTSMSPNDFWVSILAAGLLSSGKTSNLPLLLPWAVAIMPAVGVALRRPLTTAVVCILAAGASFLPMACINAKYVGDWTGLKAEGLQLTRGEPVIRVANNVVLLTIQNFVPPVFPMASAWNRATAKIIPSSFAAKIEADFEPAGAHWQLGEMQVEESAGLGFGLSVLLAGSVLAALARLRRVDGPQTDWFQLALNLSPWVSLLAFMLKSNLSTSARLASPYFGLLVPLLLLPGMHNWLVRSKWWRRAAFVLCVPALILLIVSPQRPLWPAQILLTRLTSGTSPNPLFRRALTVYSVYSLRSDSFKPVRELLPADVKVLGFLATDETEASLWRPFGSRQILHVKIGDSAKQLRERGISHVLVSTETWTRLGRQSLESWFSELGADVVEKFSLKMRVSGEPVEWYLIRLHPTPNDSTTTPSTHQN